MKIEKGIILAGGLGTRLYPITANKHLLPIYDKPAIYYPLSILMLAGVRDILIISTPSGVEDIEYLLGSGIQFGVTFSYHAQEKPNGLPEAFILGEKFINNDPVALILGDNFFHGHGLSTVVYDSAQYLSGSHIFTYRVDDPERYGIVVLDKKDKIIDIEEKPFNPKSNLAVTGLYYFDGSVSERAKALKSSARGELEIVDLIKSYITEEKISVTQFGRGYVWFDVGTPKSLLEASQYVEVIQARQGIFISSPEEIAWRMRFITARDFENNVSKIPTSKYKQYLMSLFEIDLHCN